MEHDVRKLEKKRTQSIQNRSLIGDERRKETPKTVIKKYKEKV